MAPPPRNLSSQNSPGKLGLSFIDNVVKALDNKEILISLFLDLSKAFDCLDHSQLLCKLEYYGIRGIFLNLLSYLSIRKQYLCYY